MFLKIMICIDISAFVGTPMNFFHATMFHQTTISKIDPSVASLLSTRDEVTASVSGTSPARTNAPQLQMRP